MVEEIIRGSHIFNNIILASKLCIIKVSPKSDIAIVWMDIWDAQSGKKAKELINRYFNVGSYIATIKGTNINPSIPQCKNCWKWGHATFSCRIQGIKCNGLHKSKHYHHFTWFCKANEKSNPPSLKTKKDKCCSHLFKCSSCCSNHQADSNSCSFWKHHFNHEWHNRKQQEIHENRNKLICSAMSSARTWF